ncbi:hypothetical protein PV350_04860 [Streptomyces sp. PA03-6a]|nr:hypothetical protein [Streptomyces sp. PA03-6a]
MLDAVKVTVEGLAAADDLIAKARGAGVLLSGLPEQQAELRKIRQDAVVGLRAEKVSYRKIAAALGISVARVQQIEAGERGRSTRGVAPEE